MFLVLVCKQNVLFRTGSGKVKSHCPSILDSNLYLPYVSQMTPGSSDQLGAREVWALWVICQGEMAQDLLLRVWTRTLG